jgi:hypothetical protein
LTYRDPALDWLLNVKSPVAVDIEEGGCHVLPYDTFVEIEAVGSSAVNGLVSVPGQRYALIAAIGRGFAWLGSCVRANGQRSGALLKHPSIGDKSRPARNRFPHD